MKEIEPDVVPCVSGKLLVNNDDFFFFKRFQSVSIKLEK